MLQRAVAGELDGFDDELVVATRFIERGACPYANLLPVLECDSTVSGALLEKGAAHLRARILEREVEVA